MDILIATTTIAEAPKTSWYPLILALLVAAWLGLPLGLALSLRKIRKHLTVSLSARHLLALLGILLVAVFVRIQLSEPTAMLSTYNGMNHVVESYRIGELKWNASFSVNYPLALQTLAGMLMKLTGTYSNAVFFHMTTFFSVATVLFVAGLGAVLFRSPTAALVTAGLASIFPPFITFAQSASLSVGYGAMSALAMLLLLVWRRTDSRAVLVTACLSLFLALQTRIEAPALVVPVAGIFLLVYSPAEARKLISRRYLPILVLFVFLSLPYLGVKLMELSSGSDRHSVPHARAFFELTLNFAILGLLTGATAFMVRRLRQPSAWVFPLMGAVVIGGASINEMGWNLFSTEGTTMFFSPWTTTYSITTFLFNNPLLTPMLVLILAIFSSSDLDDPQNRKTWLLVFVWMLTLTGASSMKNTGELPFEGMRTSIAASVPFLLLAGLGGTRLLERLKKTRFFPATGFAFVILVLAFHYHPLRAASDSDFNQQREFAFAADVLSDLPERATVYYADDDMEFARKCDPDETVRINMGVLYRMTKFLDSLQGTNPKHVKSTGIRSIDELTNLDPRPFYFEGLNCYRSGSNDMTETCRDIRNGFVLEPVKTTTFENRMYNSDYFHEMKINRTRVTIGLYRISNRTDMENLE